MDSKQLLSMDEIRRAAENLKGIVAVTPLQKNPNLSERYGAEIWLKREDLQQVRSYKIRGAFNKIQSLTDSERKRGVVCASAGNHAQGVASACSTLGIKGTIFMPVPTPNQKVRQVKMFGREYVDVVMTGDTFDDAYRESSAFCNRRGAVFIHPFDDEQVIAGQATIALELFEQLPNPDLIFIPIGGGGLAAGICSVAKVLSPSTRLIGVEPEGAPSMKISIEKGEIVTLAKIDNFVDGAAVKRVGSLTFPICRAHLTDLLSVPEGRVCSVILRLYNEDAIVAEPAGALSIAALDQYADQIRGKKVVCVVSGSNNDITRMEEIKERSLLYEGLKHYFIVRFPQRAGALREFLERVLGPTDDIAHFEYSKKNSREHGSAVIGIELQRKEDFKPLIKRMKNHSLTFEYLNRRPDLFQFLV